jgi:hypothetical protein
MVKRIHDLIERFPEDENAVRAMIMTDPDFNALCEEYKVVVEELRQVMEADVSDEASDAFGLRLRRVAIEEELLTRIEGYKPI